MTSIINRIKYILAYPQAILKAFWLSFVWLFGNIAFACSFILLHFLIALFQDHQSIDIADFICLFLFKRGNILLYFLPFATASVIDFSLSKLNKSRLLNTIFWSSCILLVLLCASTYILLYYKKDFTINSISSTNVVYYLFVVTTTYTVIVKTISVLKIKIFNHG